jgi:hypothetical protein
MIHNLGLIHLKAPFPRTAGRERPLGHWASRHDSSSDGELTHRETERKRKHFLEKAYCSLAVRLADETVLGFEEKAFVGLMFRDSGTGVGVGVEKKATDR